MIDETLKSFTPENDFDSNEKNEERKKRLAPQVVEIVKKHLQGKHFKLFYFGSRVDGRPCARSDFDIGIEMDGEIPAVIYFDIEEELGNIMIMQEIDFVEFYKVAENLIRVVGDKKEYFYEQ